MRTRDRERRNLEKIKALRRQLDEGDKEIRELEEERRTLEAAADRFKELKARLASQ